MNRRACGRAKFAGADGVDSRRPRGSQVDTRPAGRGVLRAWCKCPARSAGLPRRCARSASARGWSWLAGVEPASSVVPERGRAAWVVHPRGGGGAVGCAGHVRRDQRRAELTHHEAGRAPTRDRGAPPYTRRAVVFARAEVSAPRGGSVIEAGIQGRDFCVNRGRGWVGRAAFARAKVTARTGMRGIRDSAFGIGHSGQGWVWVQVGIARRPKGAGWLGAGFQRRARRLAAPLATVVRPAGGERRGGERRGEEGRGGERRGEERRGEEKGWKTGPGKAPPHQAKGPDQAGQGPAPARQGSGPAWHGPAPGGKAGRQGVAWEGGCRDGAPA